MFLIPEIMIVMYWDEFTARPVELNKFRKVTGVEIDPIVPFTVKFE